jgi:hypothetical protein
MCRPAKPNAHTDCYDFAITTSLHAYRSGPVSLHPISFVRTEVLVGRLSKDTDPSTHPLHFGSWDGANKDTLWTPDACV